MTGKAEGGTRSADLEALRLLNAGRPAEALPFARQAAAAARTCSPAHGLQATILLRLGQAEEARALVAHAMSMPPGIGDAYDALAFVCVQLGDHETANRLYRRAAERTPGEARFWYNLASSERSLGRLTEAESHCDRAIELDAGHYQTYLLRSELRRQTEGRNHIEDMERLLANRPADDRACMFLGYALGKELDDLGLFDRAFGWFSRGAAARRRHLAYDVGTDEQKLRRIQEVYAAAQPLDEALLRASRDCLFIIGLPRSGTTLLERILTRLPGVRSNGETDNFSNALLAAAPAAGSDVFARCSAADGGRIATRYRELAGLATGVKVIDKLPMNYLYVGAIRQALPGATLLLVERSPLDACFAMFRTLFGAAYPFTYEFGELARYYAAYARLIQHWQRLFGDWMVRVRYADLVSDPARQGAAIARSAGLAWNDEAIHIERNAGVSTTASASQIRQPIYQSSVGRWRHYRAHLQPLVDALRVAGVTEVES